MMLENDVEIVQETPVFHFTPVFHEDLKVYYDDVKSAKVGQKWFVGDQDQYPNRNADWENELTLIFKDEYGALLRWREGNINPPYSYDVEYETELVYVEFHE